MKHLLAYSILALSLISCQALPQLYQTIDDIEDSAIEIKIDKDSIKKDTDVIINVQTDRNFKIIGVHIDNAPTGRKFPLFKNFSRPGEPEGD